MSYQLLKVRSMYYSLKKTLKLILSVGFSPKLWILELASKFITQQRKKAPQQNDSANPYLQHTLKQTQSKKTDSFTVSLESVVNNPDKIKSLLSEYGICIIDNFIEHQSAIKAGEEMKAYFSSNNFREPRESAKNTYKEEANYLWQTDYAWTDNYLKAANFNKPVINIRSRQKNMDDAGMIDIFNVQILTSTEKLNYTKQCIEKMSGKEIESLLTSFTGYNRKQFNLYYNNGVTQTRGPHVDNNSDPYKLFVYLTDVEKDTDGPYCYLPGSSKKRDWMSFERLKNAINQNPSTEVSSLSREHLTKLFAKAGTAIITNQSGIHCGGIQSKSGERVLLVSNYY